MKQALLITLIIATTAATKAQTYIQGGLNLANITKTTDGKTEDNNILPTFNAGILSRFDLSDIIDLESGVLFTGRGSKSETYFTSSTTDNYVKARFNPYYVEVPLNVVIKFPVTKKFNAFAHAGPYAAIGVAGKSKVDSKILGFSSSSTNSIKFSDDDPFTSQQDDAAYDKLKRFDFGFNVGAGIQLDQIILKLNLGVGLTKINSTESNNTADDKNKYRTVSLSVGIPLN